MGAYGYMDTAILGLIPGISGMRDFIETLNAQEAISYGAPVFCYNGDTSKCWGAKQDSAVITASGVFTGSDTAIIVTLNGVALTPVAYASSSLATGNAVALAVQTALQATVAAGTAVFDDTGHTITIFSPGTDVTATLASSGGVNATTAYKSVAVFMGVAGFTQKSLRDTAGGYVQYEAINSIYIGFVYVYASKVVNAGSPAYVITAAGATQGYFTDSSTLTFPTTGIFRGTTTGAGIVLLELIGKHQHA